MTSQITAFFEARRLKSARLFCRFCKRNHAINSAMQSNGAECIKKAKSCTEMPLIIHEYLDVRIKKRGAEQIAPGAAIDRHE